MVFGSEVERDREERLSSSNRSCCSHRHCYLVPLSILLRSKFFSVQMKKNEYRVFCHKTGSVYVATRASFIPNLYPNDTVSTNEESDVSNLRVRKIWGQNRNLRKFVEEITKRAV